MEVCPIATPKNPRIAISLIGTESTNFLGFNSYPKLPDPQIYKLPNLSMAPEW